MRMPWEIKENKESICMKLHPTEKHLVEHFVYDELQKQKSETIISRRITEIIQDYWNIVGPHMGVVVFGESWMYLGKNVWDSLEDNGDIKILFSCSIQNPLSKITQKMLVSDDWQEELKKKVAKKEKVLKKCK